MDPLPSYDLDVSTDADELAVSSDNDGIGVGPLKHPRVPRAKPKGRPRKIREELLPIAVLEVQPTPGEHSFTHEDALASVTAALPQALRELLRPVGDCVEKEAARALLS